MSGLSMDLVRTRFMWTVQALAQPADVQVRLYPSFVAVADELALDHDEAQRAFLRAAQGELTYEQLEALLSSDTRN